jgi:hypothetical protein
MPSTFLNEDQEGIAGMVLIVEVGPNVEVIGEPQAIEETVLRSDLIILPLDVRKEELTMVLPFCFNLSVLGCGALPV